MSYLGFIQSTISALSKVPNPRVLEIGIENGHSALPILHNLEKLCKGNFLYIGVDVKLNPQVTNAAYQMTGIEMSPDKKFNAVFKEMNSLSFLQQAISEKLKFDVVFVDGDHNYFTVFNELSMIKELCHKSTLIICDDYFGRYSKKDMFYSEREGYENLKINEKNTAVKNEKGTYQILFNKTTPPISAEKEGVKSAVNDFLIKNPEWSGFNLIVPSGVDSSWVSKEPVMLYQKDHVSFEVSEHESSINFISKESMKRLHE